MPSCVTGLGSCIPFTGATVGEKIDKEGDDSKCRRERCGMLGVGGMMSVMLRANVV